MACILENENERENLSFCFYIYSRDCSDVIGEISGALLAISSVHVSISVSQYSVISAGHLGDRQRIHHTINAHLMCFICTRKYYPSSKEFRGPPTYTQHPSRCSAAKGTELDSAAVAAKQKAPLRLCGVRLAHI